MARYRVTVVYYDDGAFGYVAPPYEVVIKDHLTRAEAKAIYKHYCTKHWYDCASTNVEVLTEEGFWSNCSNYWAMEEMVEQERWFDEKGLDYEWWLQFGEVRKVG